MADQVRQYHYPAKATEVARSPIETLKQAVRDIENGLIAPDHIYVGIREGDWK